VTGVGKTYTNARFRELGAELRKRREAAGVTGAHLAHLMGWSSSKISRIESGERGISHLDVFPYLGFCGIRPPAALHLVEMAREAEHKHGHWLSPHGEWLDDSLSTLIYHESAADRSTSYYPRVIHGLLQTADYARAFIAAEQWRTPENVEECVRIRLERQRILRVRHPARFTFYLHEHALRLRVGNPKIMHEQLLKIVLLAAFDHITVRVVPVSAGERAAIDGPFDLLQYAEHRPLVYLDNHTTGLFLEDRDYVEPYRTLVTALSEVALNEGQSREVIATLASEYDQRSERDAGDPLEEEHL
jgi:transcriptional regulator with XRE-family HTH domain